MRNGGAIYFKNSNAGITNATFEANTAIKGAALYFSCLGSAKCELNVTDSRFIGKYFTLFQINKLMNLENIVNSCARSVLACLH